MAGWAVNHCWRLLLPEVEVDGSSEVTTTTSIWIGQGQKKTWVKGQLLKHRTQERQWRQLRTKGVATSDFSSSSDWVRPGVQGQSLVHQAQVASNILFWRQPCSNGLIVYFNPFHSYTLSGSTLRCLDCDDEEWMSGGRARPGSRAEPGGRARPGGRDTPRGWYPDVSMSSGWQLLLNCF